MAIRPLSALRARLQIHHVTDSGDPQNGNPWNRIVKQLLATGILGISLVGLTGCSMTSTACKSLSDPECIDEFMIGYRNRAMAEKAWHCRRHNLCDKRHAREYKDGFIQGYMEVATGGNPCIPAIAPSAYAGWEYQCADGHNAINAWFQGFPAGIQAAEEDGVGHWQAIHIRPQPKPMPLPSTPYAPSTPYTPSHSDAVIDPPANPFYSEEQFAPEQIPVPMEDDFDGEMDADDIDDIIEQIDALPEMEDADTVFDGTFPPVAVDPAGPMSTADAVIAARIGDNPVTAIEDNVSDEDTVADEGLPFTFE